MFNITVNLRKLLKKLLIVLVLIILGLVVLKYSKKIGAWLIEVVNKQYENILDTELSVLACENVSLETGMQKILSSELVTVETFSTPDEKNENTANEESVEVNSINSVEKNVVNTNEYKNVSTEIVKEKNLKESYNVEYNGVKIKNESNYELTDEILTPNIEYNNKKDILIFHTHTCEAYTQTPQMTYKETGNFRTTDLNYSVVRVGDELTKNLQEKNFNVIHDTTYHDYPAYTGSYNRSLLTVKDIVDKNSGIEMVIDLHRDAIGSKSEYGPSVKIGEEKVAQLMFVIGTDGGGLLHPNWRNNIKYAVKIQEKANEMFPGLFKPMIVRNSRYNQHLASGACIIEVGATGNTLEESIGSMKYLSEVLSLVMI